MASTPEETIQPVMELPSDPLTASLEHGNPISITIPPQPMVPITTAAILSQRRRRKSATSLKRSASTPNVRGHHSGDAGMTLAEKRRNKLGYHRTSVACGHCRRRKIRCLAAPDDPQGRCANCIRLKKECNFFPVDQQPPVERRPRASSSVNGRASTSSDSSPAINGGHLFNHDTFNFNSMPFSNNQEYPPASASMSAGVVSPMTRVPENGRPFDYPPQHRTSFVGSPYPDSGTISAGYSSPSDAAHLWGRTHSDSPVTPGFSPQVSGPTSSLTSFSDSRGSLTSFANSRSESWPTQPAHHGHPRSMSFGIVEGLQPYNNFDGNNYYPPSMPKDIRRRNSDMRPPSLQTSANSSNTSISETHLTPLSAPIPSPPSAQWSLPSAPWSAFPGTTMRKPYDDWYPNPAPLANVQEEEHSPHFGSEPAILYNVDGQ